MSLGKLLIVWPVLGFLWQAEPQPNEKPNSSSEPALYEVRLTDGSTVKIRLLTAEIEIATQYGTLKVPVVDVRRIDIGLRYPEGVEKRVEAAVAQLGSQDFRARESAGSELLRLKEFAYRPVKRALKSEDAEVRRRATDLVRELEERVPGERLELRDEDVIVTARFPIVGRIQTPVLKGSSAVFGEFQLRLTDTRQVRSTAAEKETEITVDAGRFAAPSLNEWFESSFVVEKGATLRLRADGSVNLNPQQGNFFTGPNGSAQFGNQGTDGHFMPGTLIGRIGRRGPSFKVGSQYEDKAKETGRLYFRISPGPWGQQAMGSYTVTASTELDLTGPSSKAAEPAPPGSTAPANQPGAVRPTVPRGQRNLDRVRNSKDPLQ
jgi:hypothetical protein